MESDTISKEVVSKLSWNVGHPAGDRELLGDVGETCPPHTDFGCAEPKE